ncbi:MAG TPA: hypothetical protein GX716_03325 [Firmicutes bacterium]|nr:hypothetical protein [Candidatus Fermentithermobacillaceae bacterium]
MSKPAALQLPGTIMERLQACIGMPVTVFLSGVHGDLAPEMPGMPGRFPGPGVPCPGQGFGPGFGSGFGPGTGFDPGRGSGGGRPAWPGVSSLDDVEAKRRLRGPCPEPRPPCPGPMPPCPEPTPGMGIMTTVLQGVLAFAGTDYISVNVGAGRTMSDFHEVAVPYNAIGMIICAGVPMM